jgi:hypothetical protein
MWRSLIEEFLLFVLPFCLFAGYLIIQRRNPLDVEHWSKHVFWLSIVGLAFVIGLVAYGGLRAPQQQGAYEPPHMEHGTLVPGRFK